jgi:DNA-binding MarR family transcriptional regulator
MQPQAPPIGYWIKQADVALTNGINEIQLSLGLSRTDWQVLHSIHEIGSIDSNDLANLIKEFADPASLNEILSRFKECNLLGEEAQTFMLTAKGIATHKTALEKQISFRQKAMEGISEREYEMTIATLQKITKNLTK